MEEKETKYENSFGFIVATCLRNKEHLNSFNMCIESIKKYNPENKIVVIVDFTSDEELVKEAITKNSNIIYETNTQNVPADMLSLYYFKKNKYFDKAILLQDSMHIKKKFDPSNINDVKYIWHFYNHRYSWSTIREPQNDFTKKNNIISHDDLNMYVIQNLIENKEFKEYCREIYYKKNNWCGCFGTCCIITYDFLIKLDNDTNIINLKMKMLNNRLRRSIESLFAIACQYVTKRNMEDCYDKENRNLEGEYIHKISFDRQ